MEMVSGSEENHSTHKRPICPICHKPVTNGHFLKKSQCEHIFCYYCISKNKQESGLCPV
jgi:hypothetical protein